MAWVVLEELVALGCAGDGVATTSTRALADRLGVAKDTVASALRRLLDRGLIDRLAQPHAGGGRFAAGGYRLNDVALDAVFGSGPSAPPRRAGRQDRAQPTLFDMGVSG